MTGLDSNNSFKPNLLRYTKAMAEEACHVFGSTTQVGLTQALGAMRNSVAIPILLILLASGCRQEPPQPYRPLGLHSAPTSSQKYCEDEKFFISLYGEPRSIPELEKEGLEFAARNPATVQVPFAKANRTWESLKRSYRPGDTIRAATTSGIGGRVHTTGYALSRNGCVVTLMVLSFID